MPDKSKRKVNPRRRTLFRLIIVIGIIVALIASGVYLLRPKGSQIVFIAPDENGIEQIWLVGVDNPENPRQLTFENRAITAFNIADNASRLVYLAEERQRYDAIRLLNLQTGENTLVTTCTTICSVYDLHPDGVWIVYSDRDATTDTLQVSAIVRNLDTSEFYSIGEFPLPLQDFRTQLSLQFVRDSELLVLWTAKHFFTDEIRQFHATYDLNTHELTEIEPIDIDSVVEFSADGSRYVDYNYENDIDMTIQVREPYDPTLHIAIHTGFDEGDNMPILTFYQAWHPDNESLLVSQAWSIDENTSTFELNLYNTLTGSYETLVSNHESYWEGDFNTDGTQFVYSIGFSKTDGQLAVYDLETHEEIPLPLSGYRPQWVNGGR